MLSLVEYDLLFLEKSWEWLHDAEIKHLTLTPDYTKEDQLDFYNSLSSKKDYWIKGIKENNIPIGLMGIKHINLSEKSAEYWGFIGEKKYWGKGIGKFMLDQAFTKANELELRILYLKVDQQNLRAKQLYLKKGFKIVIAGDIEQYEISL